MLKFDAVYYPEEQGERLAEWVVVEWQHVNGSSKLGRTLRSFGYDEMAAKMYVNNLNTLENLKNA